MTQPTRPTLRLADLPTNRPTPFALVATPDQCQRLATDFGILGIKKLRLSGQLMPVGQSDWRLEAALGATVVQSCGVTLDPVTTRVDEQIARHFVTELSDSDAAEAEMPEDDTIEALPEVVDLSAIMAEALSLALPAYPRAPKAELGEAVFAPKGITPLRDEDTKPFAALGKLKEALEKKDKN